MGDSRNYTHHGGSFGNYFHDKKVKLIEQQAAQRHAPAETQVLHGVVAFLNGESNPPQDQLRELLQAHGGELRTYVDREVTHVLCAHVPGAKAHNLPCPGKPWVRPEWVLRSIEAGRRLQEADFRTLGLAQATAPSIRGWAHPPNARRAAPPPPATRAPRATAPAPAAPPPPPAAAAAPVAPAAPAAPALTKATASTAEPPPRPRAAPPTNGGSSSGRGSTGTQPHNPLPTAVPPTEPAFVAVPALSQLDPSTLGSLPPDIQREILNHYPVTSKRGLEGGSPLSSPKRTCQSTRARGSSKDVLLPPPPPPPQLQHQHDQHQQQQQQQWDVLSPPQPQQQQQQQHHHQHHQPTTTGTAQPTWALVAVERWSRADQRSVLASWLAGFPTHGRPPSRAALFLVLQSLRRLVDTGHLDDVTSCLRLFRRHALRRVGH